MEEELKQLRKKIEELEALIDTNTSNIRLLTKLSGKTVDSLEELYTVLKGIK